MNMHVVGRVLLPALALPLAVLAAACGGTSKESGSTSTATETVPVKQAALALPLSRVSFGRYTSVPLLGAGARAYAGPPTPHSLDAVRMVPEVARALREPGVSDALARNGFVVVPANLRLFQYAYEGDVYTGYPLFVTTDVAYHEWHQLFDKVLRSLEQGVLLPKLEKLVDGALGAAHEQSAELAGTVLADSASRVEQLLGLAASELGQTVELGSLARAEKLLIEAHDSSQVSPLVGAKV
ncbi:MAG: DUF3160 domain-containing protein, partial [Gaiellaceae bacterium]